MNFPDSNNWAAEDYRALAREGAQRQFRPEDWLCVSACESGLVAKRGSVAPDGKITGGTGPFAFNANGGARGLTQMMPPILVNLGFKAGDPDFDASGGEYREVPIAGQIRWSGKYFGAWSKRPWLRPGDLYLANFYPAHLPHKDDPTHVLFDAATKPTTYRQNPGFDYNDGSHPAWVDTGNAMKKGAGKEYAGRKGWVDVADVTRMANKGLGFKVYLDAVRSLTAVRQSRLNDCLPSRQPLVEDGAAGPLTRSAIKAFRYAAGLPLDGGFDAVVDLALFGA